MPRFALRELVHLAPPRAGLAARMARFAVRERCSIAAIAFLAGMAAYRAWLVDTTYGSYTGCGGCLTGSVMASDAMLMCAFAALLAIARCELSRPLRMAVTLAGLTGVLLYLGDIVVFRLLSQRLLVEDMFRFSGDTDRLFTVIVPWLREPEGAIVMAAAMGAAIATAGALLAPPSGGRPMPWLIAAAVVFVPGLEGPHAEYIHELAYFNVWEVNRQVDASRPYSPEFQRLHGGAPPRELECESGLAERPSIVLVVVESLSAYHSRLFSGLNDYTPRLDELARRGSYVKAFHANGFSTDGGLIALLTGAVPIPTAGRFGSEMAFTRVTDDFHHWIASQGYLTAFFTTGDLSMGQRRAWLQAIGIAYAEGAEHPHYRGMPRGAFGAARDAALVDRFLGWYDQERPRRPFMATLLTVGTHPPFVWAGRGIVGEAEAVREADRQLARLADSLEARGFFGNGLMIIVGDHRAMTPILTPERDALGPAAEVRVMELALGRTGLPPGEVKGAFQQTDVIPSLRHVIARQSCRDEWEGRFLGRRPDPPDYVVHSNPLRRNELTVIAHGREYRMRLDGDDTAFIESPPPAAAEALRQRVNYERISRMREVNGLPAPR